jgi:alpha-L-rhamnosidase
LNFESAGGEEQKQRDVYICNGKECVCEPNFTWHGFRYFSLEGPSLPVECVVVHTPVENKTEFECDNEILNWIYDSYVRTQLDNMHMGVPSDCPHRERLGYTGDGQLACGAAMYILDTKDFYYKWIRDILDCQDINTGRIQHTAPFYGGGGGSGGWGCAVVVVPYNHYKHFFYKNVLIESYPYMKKWVEYMFTQTEDDLVVYEEKDAEINPDYWGLGDWCTPEAVEIPKAFVNTYYLIKSLMYMKEIACIINEKFDYESKLSDFKKALVRKYFDNDTHTFFKSVQGADAFALDIDLGDEETEKKLLKKYSAADGFDTGIFGTYVLINVLFERGYADEAVRLLTSEGKNSFGNMMKAGATTLWERWDSLWSHNHPMFGAVVEHIFSYLIGIRFENFKKIIIEPQYTHLIKRIKATVKTNTGAIEIEHKLCGDMCRTKINVYCKEEVLFLYNDEKYTVMDTLNIVKKIKY